MKILFLNTNIGYGGASKMMAWVANQMALNGEDVVFLTYRDKTELQQLNEKVDHVHFDLEGIEGRGKGLLHTVRFLHDYIKKNKFDLAVAFLSPSFVRLALACKGTRTKMLFSHRGDPYQKATSFTGRLLNTIIDKAFRSADYYVFQTEAARSYYPQSIRRKGRVIANPIKPLVRTQSRSGNVEKRIVNIARLDINQKRQDLLIDAFNKISGTYPDYVLELYGDGADERILNEQASSNKQIHFMGKTSDVVGVSQNAAISVLSSDFEGIPNSLLESMSLGIPCISTDCSPGGAAMLIRNRENGLLVPRGDADSLAKAMSYMIEHREDAEQMGINGMEVNDKYSEATISKMWMDYLAFIKSKMPK